MGSSFKKIKKMVFGMMDSFGRAIKKVDSFMDKDGVVQTQLNWFEARTRVKKRYILAGCIILTGWLMFGLLAPFVVSLVSFVYPAIQSVKVLEEDRGAGRWLIYWLVLGTFNLVEFFADLLLAWLQWNSMVLELFIK